MPIGGCATAISTTNEAEGLHATQIFRHRRRTRRSGEPPITPDLVMKLGWAAGARSRPAGVRAAATAPACSSARTRASPATCMEAALESGLSAAGVDVYLCGPLPTPGIAYLTRALRLSARHRDQRLAQSVRGQRHQVLLRDGRQAARRRGGDHRAQHGRAARPACRPRRSARRGAWTTPRAATSSSARARSRRARPRGLAHRGRLRATAPAITWRRRVFHELGADVIAVGDEPDGLNINAGVRRDASAVPRRPRCASTRPTSASRSTATATASSWCDRDGPHLRRRRAALRDRAPTTSGAASRTAASSARR